MAESASWIAPSPEAMHAVAAAEFAALPAEFRDACGEVRIVVADFPDDETMRTMDLESEFDILGLYHGVALPHRSGFGPEPSESVVYLYRRPILDYWAEHEERLGDVIRHVLIHEIGHHFGFSDDDMDRIESEAG